MANNTMWNYLNRCWIAAVDISMKRYSKLKLPLRGSALLMFCLSMPFAYGADYALPQYDGNTHMGVASCASSSCHGKTIARLGDQLPLNEYRRWAYHDIHAKSYSTLLSKRSQDIAAKLNIGPAQEADICLDCHVDNPPEELRGERFQIDDGIGCEACHGGSEKWLSSHTNIASTHQDNIDNGMYPTDQPKARAQLCISCHLGNANKMATHKIMGAGHPRLRFEMSAYTANMTPHFENSQWDLDQGKQTPNDLELWTRSLIESAQTIMALWDKHLNSNNWIPEVALFDCHSCHHSMDKIQWHESEYRPGVEPGQIRLNTALLEVLVSITKVTDQDLSSQLLQTLSALHSGVSAQQRLDAVVSMKKILSELDTRFTAQQLSTEQLAEIRKQLIKDAAKGNFNSFMLAEKAYLILENICYALKDIDQHRPALDRIFNTIGSETDYHPGDYQREAAQWQKLFHAQHTSQAISTVQASLDNNLSPLPIIFFGNDEYLLSTENQHHLLMVAKTLKQSPKHTLLIEGHSSKDTKQGSSYNQTLALSRANSVLKFLVQTGIDAKRLTATSAGYAQPLNNSSDLASSRRVTLSFNN